MKTFLESAVVLLWAGVCVGYVYVGLYGSALLASVAEYLGMIDGGQAESGAAASSPVMPVQRD